MFHLFLPLSNAPLTPSVLGALLQNMISFKLLTCTSSCIWRRSTAMVQIAYASCARLAYSTIAFLTRAAAPELGSLSAARTPAATADRCTVVILGPSTLSLSLSLPVAQNR